MNAVRRGSALILALWTVFFLGALALAVGGHVSASIAMARYMKHDLHAHYLARAGVELAVSEILNNGSNYTAYAYESLPDREMLFHDNRSLPHGVFSVYYLYYSTNLRHTVTNYGVAPETLKWNLDEALSPNSNKVDALRLGLRACLGSQGPGADLAERIVSYPQKYLAARVGEKPLPKPPQRSYGGYENQLELYAVDGMNETAFSLLETQVTVLEYLREYVSGGRGEYRRRQSFGGVAEGRVLVRGSDGNGQETARQRITFVFDGGTTNFLYWREHE